jgi:hypothetical protein
MDNKVTSVKSMESSSKQTLHVVTIRPISQHNQHLKVTHDRPMALLVVDFDILAKHMLLYGKCLLGERNTWGNSVLFPPELVTWC